MAVNLTGPVKLSEVGSYLGLPAGSIKMNDGKVRSQVGAYTTDSTYKMSDMRGMMTQYGPNASNTTSTLATYYTKFWSGGSQTNAFNILNWDASSGNNGADGYTSYSRLGTGVDKGKSASTAWVCVADVLAQSGSYGGGLFTAEWKFRASRSSSHYRHMVELVGMSEANASGSVSYIHTEEFTLGESTQSYVHSWTSIRPHIQCSVYNHALEGSSAGQILTIDADYCNLKLIS